jgi:hypothetical protein
VMVITAILAGIDANAVVGAYSCGAMFGSSISSPQLFRVKTTWVTR